MRFGMAVGRGSLLALVAFAACGGEVSGGTERGDASPGVAADDGGTQGTEASPGGGVVGYSSCAALADCCGGFTGSTAASCEAVADTGDDPTCSNQVDVYQSQGFCE